MADQNIYNERETKECLGYLLVDRNFFRLIQRAAIDRERLLQDGPLLLCN